MIAIATEKHKADAGCAGSAANSGASDVLVCIDEDQSFLGSIPHAQVIASSLGGNVLLLQVIAPPAKSCSPLDPVDWELRRYAAKIHLTDIAQQFETPDRRFKITILEGRPLDQICVYASKSSHNITAMSRDTGPTRRHTWGTSRGVLESGVGSILMVPTDAPTIAPQRYLRILVPLDGSSLAESALPKAVAIARAQRADLIVCHVIPEPGITRIGPHDSAADNLCARLISYNERIAHDYLNRVLDEINRCGLSARKLVFSSGDARRSLMNAVRAQAPDLIVLGAHGQSGNFDEPTGHVATFILDHAQVPVLMVREQRKPGDGLAFSRPYKLRRGSAFC